MAGWGTLVLFGSYCPPRRVASPKIKIVGEECPTHTGIAKCPIP